MIDWLIDWLFTLTTVMAVSEEDKQVIKSLVQNKDEKSAQRDANTARAGCSKVRTPPVRPLQTHTHTHIQTDRTYYNTLRR